MAKLIAITGMDGCGKSSVTNFLQQQFPNSFVAEIWQPMYGKHSPFSSKQAVDNYLCSLTTEARSLFLTHALLESTQNALTSDADILFLNAYYYKYFASELAMGTSEKVIEQLIALFPKPDVVIEITCPIDLVTQRKQHYSRYECGCVNEANAATFLNFQSICKEHWTKFRTTIDASFENLSTMEELLSTIEVQVKQII
jgi:thymidylate kinase